MAKSVTKLCGYSDVQLANRAFKLNVEVRRVWYSLCLDNTGNNGQSNGFFCTVHYNVIIKYKPTKCIFSKLIFKFLIFFCLVRISNPRVHLQEDGCIYRYGIVSIH